MSHACRVRLGVQPVHVQRLAQREERDACEEGWGAGEEQHHSHKAAALGFNCFVRVPERILKPNTQKKEESF